MNKLIDFYFDFISPYSYLAHIALSSSRGCSSPADGHKRGTISTINTWLTQKPSLCSTGQASELKL